MSSCCKVFWTSNRWRHISGLFCFSVTLILTLVMLIATSTNVTKAISWSNVEYHYWPVYPVCTRPPCPDPRPEYTEWFVVNVGLLTSQKCWTYSSGAPWPNGCEDVPTAGIVEGPNLTNAGRGVITANSFGMLFTVLAVLLLELIIYMPKWVQKLKFPRIILFILCFLMLTMYIVSVATWFQLANDKMASGVAWEPFHDGSVPTRIDNVTAGYAVAVNIFIIVLAFFAWLFTFLRIQFPNHAEDENTSIEGVGMTSEVGKAISMQYQPPAVTLSPSHAMGAYEAYNSVNSPQPMQKRGFFG